MHLKIHIHTHSDLKTVNRLQSLLKSAVCLFVWACVCVCVCLYVFVCVCVCVEMRPVPCSCWTEPADVTHWLSAQQAQETDPAGGEGWGQTDRQTDARTHTHTHTHAHTEKSEHRTHESNRHWRSCRKSTSGGIKNIWTQTESYTYDAPERPWQQAIQMTTYNDILLLARQEQEQSSALMRQLTFSRHGHTEAALFQLIQQITSYYQKLIDAYTCPRPQCTTLTLTTHKWVTHTFHSRSD